MSEIFKGTCNATKNITSHAVDAPLNVINESESASEAHECINKTEYLENLVDNNISAHIISEQKLIYVLNSLSDISRNVFTMYIKGYDVKEIASECNISINEVYRLIRANRKRCLNK